jgi:hypothetical protein
VSAKSRDSADSLDSEIVFDLSDELKRRWPNLSVKLTGAFHKMHHQVTTEFSDIVWR